MLTPKNESLPTSIIRLEGDEHQKYKLQLLGFMLRTIVHIIHNPIVGSVEGKSAILHECSREEHAILLRSVSNEGFLLDLAGYNNSQKQRIKRVKCNWKEQMSNAINNYKFLASTMRDPIPPIGILCERLMLVHKRIRLPAIEGYINNKGRKSEAQQQWAYGFGKTGSCLGAAWLLDEKQTAASGEEVHSPCIGSDRELSTASRTGDASSDDQCSNNLSTMGENRSSDETTDGDPCNANGVVWCPGRKGEVVGDGQTVKSSEQKTDHTNNALETMYSSIYQLKTREDAMALTAKNFLPDYAYCEKN